MATFRRNPSRALTAAVESSFGSIFAVTACALRDALLGTSTNAIIAKTNTPAAIPPRTATLRSAFLALAETQR